MTPTKQYITYPKDYIRSYTDTIISDPNNGIYIPSPFHEDPEDISALIANVKITKFILQVETIISSYSGKILDATGNQIDLSNFQKTCSFYMTPESNGKKRKVTIDLFRKKGFFFPRFFFYSDKDPGQGKGISSFYRISLDGVTWYVDYNRETEDLFFEFDTLGEEYLLTDLLSSFCLYLDGNSFSFTKAISPRFWVCLDNLYSSNKHVDSIQRSYQREFYPVGIAFLRLLLKEKEKINILEIGSGSGAFAKSVLQINALSKDITSYHLIEKREKSINESKDKLKKWIEEGKIHLHQKDLNSSDFSTLKIDEKVDVIIGFGALVAEVLTPQSANKIADKVTDFLPIGGHIFFTGMAQPLLDAEEWEKRSILITNRVLPNCRHRAFFIGEKIAPALPTLSPFLSEKKETPMKKREQEKKMDNKDEKISSLFSKLKNFATFLEEAPSFC